MDRVLCRTKDRQSDDALVGSAGANLFWVLLAFSIAMVSAEFSIVFNDSMMPRLVPREEIGRVSNLAWGLGYLGGMIVLIFVVFCLAASPETGKTIIGMKPLFGLDPVQGKMPV